MRQLIDLQEKTKGKRKENLWYRLENPTGTLGSYLGKKKRGVSRESNRGRGAQITERYHRVRSNWVKDF